MSAISKPISDLSPADSRWQRFFWAGFIAILAGGIGFAIRGAILLQWAGQYGFTFTELGEISGYGLTGFGIVIIIFGLAARRMGCGGWLGAAFALHVISAVVTLGAGAAFAAGGKPAAFRCLSAGMFLFAAGNGLAEGAVYRLASSALEKERARYRNLLNVAWPAGMFLGALAAYCMAEGALSFKWQIQMSLFIIPVIGYGAFSLFGPNSTHRQHLDFKPRQARLLRRSFSISVLAALLGLQAMQGFVEFGTNTWLSNIAGQLLASPREGLLLFAYVSALMCALRMFSSALQRRISRNGILLVSCPVVALGLDFFSHTHSAAGCLLGATCYAAGVAFTWPLLISLAVERCPQQSVLVWSVMAAVGMLSAGMVGGPGIGYAQETHAVRKLLAEHPAVFQHYKAPEIDRVLKYYTPALDGAKVASLNDKNPPPPDKSIIAQAQRHGAEVALRMLAVIPVLQFILLLCLVAAEDKAGPAAAGLET